jgi:hypothetical protein
VCRGGGGAVACMGRISVVRWALEWAEGADSLRRLQSETAASAQKAEGRLRA